MKISIKKETLLVILEALFHDDSRSIEDGNCIQFYHFLLDTLEREILEIPIKQDADISLCFSITELLCNFDLINDKVSWDYKGISEYLKNYGGLSDAEFQVSISKFRDMYTSIKNDFLLGFS